jgi:hypothetical protein
VRASLGSLGCALAVFLAVGAAQWSQLMIGWQWSDPAGTASATAFATVVTSGAMLALLALAVAAALPALYSLAKNFTRRLRAPAALLLAAPSYRPACSHSRYGSACSRAP